jgi:multiple antibiotic resistance protein
MDFILAFYQNLLLSFIPIFIAIDVIGVLPLVVGLTDTFDKPTRNKVIRQSVITAGIAGVVFLFVGEIIFRIIGVSVNDFRIAGGTILLTLSILDLISDQDKKWRISAGEMGVFPIGTPLIAGPGVLAAILTCSHNYSATATLTAFVLNLAIVFVAFMYASRVLKFLGAAGTKAIGKLANLLLAAYAVMLIRSGIESFISGSLG